MKITTFKTISFVFSSVLFHSALLCTESPETYKSSVPSQAVHVVYSHAWFEDATLKKYDREEQRWIDGRYNNDVVMTFKKNNTIQSASGRDIPLADDDTSFYNSYAMKFACLGDSLSMPSYPGEPRSWSLYSEACTHALADHLYNRVVEGKNKIVLVGPCVGASVAINCLKKLAHFDDNKEYFKGSLIQEKNDAQQIIDAINNGGFIAINPLMSIKQHNAVAVPAAVLTGLTIAAVCVAVYRFSLNNIDSLATQLGCAVAPGLLNCAVMTGYCKNLYATMIKYDVVPVLSGFNYNPWHEDPIDNIEGLKDVITGQKAVHFTEQDWVMEWKNDDLLKLFKAFGKKNIYITDDVGHMKISPAFLTFLQGNFKNKCLCGDEYVEMDENGHAIKRLSSIDDINKEIYPWGIFSQFGSKRWIVALIFLGVMGLWMKFGHFNAYVH